MSARVNDLQVYLDERSIPEPNTGCWLWFGNTTNNGYGRTAPLVLLKNKAVLAHRLSYELNRGSIPRNKQLDHLCRMRCCINPEHLEIVTQKENILRGIGPTATNAAKNFCINGHEFTLENTMLRKSGTRGCRACQYAANGIWKNKNKHRVAEYSQRAHGKLKQRKLK